MIYKAAKLVRKTLRPKRKFRFTSIKTPCIPLNTPSVMASKSLTLYLFILISSCSIAPNNQHSVVQSHMKAENISKIIYINGNTCLPCIQTEIMKLQLDTQTWVVLHPKIDFLKNSFEPRVWVDWGNTFDIPSMDTSYFHIFINEKKWTYASFSNGVEVIDALQQE